MKKHNYFTKNYTPSNKKKKEEMDKAVKLVHEFMVYNIVKKFMNYDFELPEGMTEEEASKILVKMKNDKSFQKELKLEKVQN